MYCDRCGKEIPDDSVFCRFCSYQLATIAEDKGNSHSQVEQGQDEVPARTEPEVKRTHISGDRIAAGVGAVIMLISLAFPWYAVRLYGGLSSHNVTFMDLITETGGEGPVWFGSALPVIAVIVLAVTALLSIFFSLLGNIDLSRVWCWLGILSGGCIITNALYLLFWMHDYYDEWIYLVNTGVVVAFVGAVVMSLSHPKFIRNLSEPG